MYSSLSDIEQENSYGWINNKFPINSVKAVNKFREAVSLLSGIKLNEAKTNLANELMHFGRFIEGLYIWPKEFKNIGDARDVTAFQKAKGFWQLAYLIEDTGHANYYLFEAYKIYKDLKTRENLIGHPDIKQAIKNNDAINNFLKNGDKNFASIKELKDICSNPTYEQDEKNYRKWCLNNCLFLNHLNDITNTWVTDQDILQFPTHTTNLLDGPFWATAFSSIKREFCFSRFLLYEGLHDVHPEFENQRMFLTDTLDYVSYSGSIEKIKTSIRVLFSLFDSLYGLMNHYFNESPKGDNLFNGRNIKSNFGHFNNPYINSLYWLACDLTDNDHISSEYWYAPNPSAKHLRKLRNSLEHGWVRIAESKPPWNNKLDYAEVFSIIQLKKMALELAMLGRSAILYFVLAVKHNETSKECDKIRSIAHSTPILGKSE